MTRIGPEAQVGLPREAGGRGGRPGAEAVRDRPVEVWGLTLAPLTRAEAAEAVFTLIERGRPSYFVTANAHYAMLSDELPALAAVNRGAAFVLADGAPLVWASRRLGTPLPERVAGSDLVYDLCEGAARRGLGLFLLGGAPGVAGEAGRRLAARYPGLRVVGAESPAIGEPDGPGDEGLVGRVRASGAHLLFAALGQPKGELWIARNLEALGVPVCVQVGASLDFAAGRVRRAPRFLQATGLEWAYRMALEPARLAPRYARNGRFVLRMLWRDAVRRGGRA